MKTLTYATTNSKVINLTRSIPESSTIFVDGQAYHLLKTGGYNDPSFNADGLSSCMPDLLFAPPPSNIRTIMPWGLHETAFNHVYFLDRLEKGKYNAIINKAMQGVVKGFHPTVVLSDPHSNAGDVKEWVIRPVYGACGYGINKVPNSKSLEWAWGKIVNKQFDELGWESNTALEGNVAEQPFEFAAFINDVKEEWRLITDHKGLFALACPRERLPNAAGFTVACGVNTPPEDLVHFNSLDGSVRGGNTDKANKVTQIVTTLNRMLQDDEIRHFNYPLHSFDLFIREDGSFGFFEMSCEFGAAALPNNWVFTQTKLFLEDTFTRIKEQRPDIF